MRGRVSSAISLGYRGLWSWPRVWRTAACRKRRGSDDERVAGAQEVEQHLQFATAVARLLGADYLATGCLQRCALNGQVLVEGRDPSVAVEGHER